jgi:hypothetical protein
MPFRGSALGLKRQLSPGCEVMVCTNWLTQSLCAMVIPTAAKYAINLMYFILGLPRA